MEPKMYLRPFIAVILAVGVAAAQESVPASTAPAAGNVEYLVNSGTTVPLALINTVSTKHSAEGDRVYLETAFPVVVNGRIVIPVGSYVAGTVTQIKRPGRVKGRGEVYVRFDSLTLPNGVTREFRGRVGGADGHSNKELERNEGKVVSEGNKGGDVRTIAETSAAGASLGSIVGASTGHIGTGLGVGTAAGAAAGLIGVLATRGPDAILARGTTLDMVLDRPLTFQESDLNFGAYQAPRVPAAPPAAPATNQRPISRRIP
jgi:type IV secretion system protein VirB10